MKLIVADDHPMVRAGLTQILAGLDAELEIIEATDFTSARVVLEGGTYAPTSLASASQADLAPAPTLTPRQRDVLAMGVVGASRPG